MRREVHSARITTPADTTINLSNLSVDSVPAGHRFAGGLKKFDISGIQW
jgi:hypothetical protein